MRNAQAEEQPSGEQEAIREIALSQLTPSPTNQRKKFFGIDELAASIKRKGVLVPLLVRQIEAATKGEERFEIIAGERRYKAALRAGLETVPCIVRTASDEEALEDQIIENLQRADLHPLEEAEGFKQMREISELDERTIAARVGKKVTYITHRLKLTDLIKEAKADFLKGLITLGHALEICRLTPEVQAHALAACYETKQTWTDSGWVYSPDKEQPARPVRALERWLRENVQLNLRAAPFKTDDTRLREDGLACVDCPQRTGNNAALFSDIKEADTCLNPPCFEAKVQRLVQITKESLEQKQQKPAAELSPNYGTRSEGVLTRYDYEEIERKADRCEYAERGVFVEGQQIGRTIWICREKTCKDHLGKAGTSTVSTISSGAVNPLAGKERRQDLFDARVAEEVRKRVFAEAVKTFSFPLQRAELNTVASQFFRRITSFDQSTIFTVLGWDEQKSRSVRGDERKMLAEIEQMDDNQLAQFLMLCTFAHAGANQYMNGKVDQTEVEQLSKARGVNYKLIDAQVRYERAPKKRQATHKTYLDKVVAGSKSAKKPLIYDLPPKAAATNESATSEATTDVEQAA